MLITTACPSRRACAQQLEHVDLMMRIEMIDRLVEQVHVGILREQRRDRDASSLAARQRGDVALRQLLQVDGRERRGRDAPIIVALPLPEADVRMPADQHGFQDGRGKRILGRLREQTEAACELASRPLARLRSSRHNRSAGRRAQARQRVQRQCLAGAVAGRARRSRSRRAPGNRARARACGRRSSTLSALASQTRLALRVRSRRRSQLRPADFERRRRSDTTCRSDSGISAPVR